MELRSRDRQICWSSIERLCNGQLDSIEKTIKWASTMTWNGIKESINLVDKIYQKGVSLSKEEMKKFQSQIQRSVNLPNWDVKILPEKG
jgi:hypothetical protein